MEKNNPENLSELLEKNLKLSELIFDQNKIIKRRLGLMVAGSYLRVLLVAVPLVLGVLYLPSFIKQIETQFESFLGGGSKTTGGAPALDISKILKNISPEQMQAIQRSLK